MILAHANCKFMNTCATVLSGYSAPLIRVNYTANRYRSRRDQSHYHLRYHLWAWVHGDPWGSNDVVPEGKARKQGPNGTQWGSTEPLNLSLRIRRPQVRVLPSAL